MIIYMYEGEKGRKRREAISYLKQTFDSLKRRENTLCDIMHLWL